MDMHIASYRPTFESELVLETLGRTEEEVWGKIFKVSGLPFDPEKETLKTRKERHWRNGWNIHKTSITFPKSVAQIAEEPIGFPRPKEKETS